MPGAIGAVVGAYVLVNLTEDAEPYMAGILLLLGVYVILRFSSRAVARRVVSGPRPGGRFLGPLGLVAGFLDASGGGGWGPVATSSLLASGRLEPRKVVGSVDTSEFVVALAASIGFLFTLSQEGIDYTVVLALMIGGMIAAPFAAYIVRLLPARVLGTGAGGLIVITNTRTLLNGLDVDSGIVTVTLLVLAVVWIAAIVVAVRSAPRAGRGRPAGRGRRGRRRVLTPARGTIEGVRALFDLPASYEPTAAERTAPCRASRPCCSTSATRCSA